MSRYYLRMEKKTCVTCGVDFDNDAKHFVERDGVVMNQCIGCHKKNVRAGMVRRGERRQKALQRVEHKALEMYGRLAATGGSNIPHSAEVVECVMQYFGGVNGFSAMLVKQFYDSKPGSSVRNKLLETICRLVQSNVDSGGAKKPLDLWTEEELEAELNARFAALRGGYVINATSTEAPAVESASDPDDGDFDNASEERDASTDESFEGEETGGVEALPADPPAAEDS